jgi:hypothetical protein
LVKRHTALFYTLCSKSCQAPRTKNDPIEDLANRHACKENRLSAIKGFWERENDRSPQSSTDWPWKSTTSMSSLRCHSLGFSRLLDMKAVILSMNTRRTDQVDGLIRLSAGGFCQARTGSNWMVTDSVGDCEPSWRFVQSHNAKGHLG